ncbi:hypothetical protein GF360_00285 [candidate division WWE3 bacterium]|nr:hypothetical protein [candidate division WWE3 bacterium]
MKAPRRLIRHKVQLLRLLREILSNEILANELVFKGGTYAALRGFLDRFSVDLDFDLLNQDSSPKVKQELHTIFADLDLAIKDESRNYLQFFLRYDAPENARNTLKIDINDAPSSFNSYERAQLQEVRMFCQGHTPETMFSNKLVAATARFEKKGKIAGRDFYDIHRFFEQGIAVNARVVEERTGKAHIEYLEYLRDFITKHITEKRLREDLNPLMDTAKLNKILPHLKPELLMLLDSEIARS